MRKSTHLHHIIPKHMGGTNDASNLIELTVEEHAEAHRKLYEKHGFIQDKIAWLALTGTIGKEEIRRMASSAAVKNTMFITDGEKIKRLKKTEEIPEGWYKKKMEISEEKIQHLREINTGIPRPKDEKFRMNVSETLKKYYKENPFPKGFNDGSAWLGRKHSEKTKADHSKRMKGLTWKIDPNTGKRVWLEKYIMEENERIEKLQQRNNR